MYESSGLPTAVDLDWHEMDFTGIKTKNGTHELSERLERANS